MFSRTIYNIVGNPFFLIITIALYHLSNTCTDAKTTTYIDPSHDTFIRKNKSSKINGKGSKITVTKQGANQRIGLIQFDTSNYGEQYFQNNNNNIKAMLRLGIAETHDNDVPVQVKVFRLENDFHEEYVSWHNFDGDADADNHITINVERSHVDNASLVDVSPLLRPGSNTVFAFVIESDGYVKFHSKEHEEDSFRPKLIISHDEL